ENSKSPIFLHELAGRITSAGKYNLNLDAEFIIKKGFRIKYEDTDSLYLTCPDRYYKKCDEAFFRKELSKEAYWTEMVKITMNVMKRLGNQVNAYLRIKKWDVLSKYSILRGTTVGICAYFVNKNDSFLLLPSDKIMQIKDSDKRKKEIDIYS
ncbi:6614_t:CDS:2, partial [Funneliformis geosporum]